MYVTCLPNKLMTRKTKPAFRLQISGDQRNYLKCAEFKITGFKIASSKSGGFCILNTAQHTTFNPSSGYFPYHLTLPQ